MAGAIAVRTSAGRRCIVATQRCKQLNSPFGCGRQPTCLAQRVNDGHAPARRQHVGRTPRKKKTAPFAGAVEVKPDVA